MTKGLTGTFRNLYQEVRSEIAVRKKIQALETGGNRHEAYY
jgi:hypothetical protein